MQLYPLKFTPIFKDKIWGGHKISAFLKKDTGNLLNCGESWEISGVPGNISIVRSGPLSGKKLTDLISEFKSLLLGEHIYERFGDEFPLLIKFIDAHDDLSVQVHPNDELARKRHNSPGKTEMWYIIHAEKGASLISGFKREIEKDDYSESLKNGNLMDLLNVETVEKDDVFFIPAGRVHTIGKGILLAEIQQTSDVTYRIFDFNRKDADGNPRELHTEASIDAIDYGYYETYRTLYNKKEINNTVELARSDYFITNRLFFDSPFERDFSGSDTFRIMICLEGNGSLEYGSGRENISTGEVVLLPASLKKIGIIPDGNIKLLETFIG